MTHLRSKRLPRPGHARTLAAVVGMVAALGLGTIGQAKATPASPAEPFGSNAVVTSDKAVTAAGDTADRH